MISGDAVTLKPFHWSDGFSSVSLGKWSFCHCPGQMEHKNHIKPPSNTAWWLTYPSEKYESQMGVLFPIYGGYLFPKFVGWCSLKPFHWPLVSLTKAAQPTCFFSSRKETLLCTRGTGCHWAVGGAGSIHRIRHKLQTHRRIHITIMDRIHHVRFSIFSSHSLKHCVFKSTIWLCNIAMERSTHF